MKFISPPTYILLACMPKSGSTFLSTAIGNLAGFRNGSFIPAYDRREQELDDRYIRKWRFSGHRAVIAQQHVRFSQPTQGLIKRFDMKTVVLIRDLFDVIVSIRDHFRHDVTTSPMAFFNERHRTLDDRQLEEAIARLEMPWYINFYMSWREANGVVWVNYEDLARDPHASIEKILDSCGLSVCDTAVERAIEMARHGKTRFNRGITGRGGSLAPETRKIVLDALKFYPEARNDPFIAAMFDSP